MILLILTKDLFHVYVDNYHVILQISLNPNLPNSVEYEELDCQLGLDCIQ